MGDLRNALKKVQTACRVIKLTPCIDVKEIGDGSVKEYLRVYHYLFLDYNPQIAAEIVNKHNVELSFANDKAFVDGVYRLCRDMLGFTPRLTKDQFFHAGFAQAKAEMAAEIIERVRLMAATTTTTAGGLNLAAVGGGGSTNNSITAASVRLRAESSDRETRAGTNSTMANTSPSFAPVNSVSSSSSASSMSSVSKNSVSSSSSSLARQPSTKSTSSTLQTSRFAYQPRVVRSTIGGGNTNNREHLESIAHHHSQTNGAVNEQTESEAQRRACAVDSLLMVGLVEKINDMHAKMDQFAHVLARVDQMDQRLANVEKLTTELRRVDTSATTSNNNTEVTKLGKSCEAVNNKLTLLETELLIIKQSLSQQQSRVSRLSYDPNDSTTYETPHQSFMLAASPKSAGRGNNNTNGLDTSETHDITLNSTDLTPTLPENLSGARLLNGAAKPASGAAGGNLEENINRARELLQRASLLSSTISSNGVVQPNLVA